MTADNFAQPVSMCVSLVSDVLLLIFTHHSTVKQLRKFLLVSIKKIKNLPTAQGVKRRRAMTVRESRQYLLVEEMAMTTKVKNVADGLVMIHAHT